MASTNFTDFSTKVQASWLNEVDALVHDVFAASTTAAAAKTALAITASDVTYTPSWSGALPRTIGQQLDQVVYVENFIPEGTVTATTDCTAFIQAALDAGVNKTIDFGLRGTWQVTYRTNSTLHVKGHNTRIEGRGALIDYYGSGIAWEYDLVGGTTYAQNVTLRQLFINVNSGAGSIGILGCTSYGTFEEVGVTLKVAATGAIGWKLPGDETGGTGPYYNLYSNCTVQSNSLSLDHTGWLFSTVAPLYRGPNANTWIAGRVGQCAAAFKITGNGNIITAMTVENVNTSNGVCFDFIGPVAAVNTQNQVIGGYIENAQIGFRIDSNTNGTILVLPYMTGVGTVLSDSSTDAQILGSAVPNKLPSGIDFTNTTASADANVLDDYLEGTWTPTLVGATVAGTYSIAATGAIYTKVGRQVTVHAKMVITTTIAGTGTCRFGGLPFAKGANQFLSGGCILENITLAATIQSVSPAAFTSGSDSTFVISGTRSAAAQLPIDCADILAGATAYVTFSYMV